MRCKCGFNSFDHNLVCPRCRKDLTATRRLLNLDIPAPGGINFFQIARQRMAAPQPFPGAAGSGEDFGAVSTPVNSLSAHLAAMDQIKSTLTETGDLIPEAEEETPAPDQAAWPGEGGDDDLSA